MLYFWLISASAFLQVFYNFHHIPGSLSPCLPGLQSRSVWTQKVWTSVGIRVKKSVNLPYTYLIWTLQSLDDILFFNTIWYRFHLLTIYFNEPNSSQANPVEQKTRPHSSSTGWIIHDLNKITYDRAIENSTLVTEMYAAHRPAPAESDFSLMGHFIIIT